VLGRLCSSLFSDAFQSARPLLTEAASGTLELHTSSHASQVAILSEMLGLPPAGKWRRRSTI